MILHGYRNVAYYPGPRAEGYVVWFLERKRRDRAIEWLRDRAIRDGIAPGAAWAGIYAVSQPSKILSEDQLEELQVEGSLRV